MSLSKSAHSYEKKESPPVEGKREEGAPEEKSICFITSGHLASNPRLVREATAAEEAGYDISVVFNQHLSPSVCEHDEKILDEHPGWDAERVVWTKEPWEGYARWFVSGVRRRAARWLFHVAGMEATAPWAQSRTYSEMLRAARRFDADLYTARHLEALCVAAQVAREKDARLGFDAKDFHRGELPDTPESEEKRHLYRVIEERYLPQADFITAASDGIAEAYAETLDIDRPTTILNVFPLNRREGGCNREKLSEETPDEGRSIHWFSQTIGPNRGLEDALRALPHLPDDTYLSLRGRWSESYRGRFMKEAERLGVADRIRTLGRVPSGEVVQRASEHDVGIVLEQPSASQNRDICVTHKFFAYLLAGLPVASTATTGQKPFCEELDRAVKCYPPGDAEALSRSLQELLDDPGAPEAAREAAEVRYNWDHEKEKFLGLVRSVEEKKNK